MIRKPINIDKVDDFIKGAKDMQPGPSTDKRKTEKAKVTLIRKTYYMTPLLIKALSLMAAFEDIDKSKIVRNALESYIPEKYINQAKEMEGDFE